MAVTVNALIGFNLQSRPRPGRNLKPQRLCGVSVPKIYQAAGCTEPLTRVKTHARCHDVETQP